MPIIPDSSHPITPKLGTARRGKDGEAADLLNPPDYPIIAICLECGELIRAENFHADWQHLVEIVRSELRKEAEKVNPRPALAVIMRRIHG